MLFPSILAFFTPLAIYCWVLAYINRRSRPTMVHGVWDCVGMLLAAGGILLMVVPFIIQHFFLTSLINSLDNEAEVINWWRLFWGLYFTLLLAGVSLMLRWCRKKTVIYNVDPDMFSHVLDDSLENLGLESARKGNRLVIWDKAAEPGARHGEVTVEPFPAMCNVSLHWHSSKGYLRTAVETRLAQVLEGARVFDNPAAGWFLGLTGLFSGLIFLTGSVWFLINYLPPRHW